MKKYKSEFGQMIIIKNANITALIEVVNLERFLKRFAHFKNQASPSDDYYICLMELNSWD